MSYNHYGGNKPSHDRDSERSGDRSSDRSSDRRAERPDREWGADRAGANNRDKDRDRDRERDRDRDRAYFGRYSQQRYGAEYESGSAFRRPDGSDYYNYRGSYREGGGRERAERERGGERSGGERSDRDRDRDRDRGGRRAHYDSYQGSKYRPGKKPYGWSARAEGDERDGASSERRSGSRGSEWDASYKRHQRPYAVRDQYKPERRSATPTRPPSEEKSERDADEQPERGSGSRSEKDSESASEHGADKDPENDSGVPSAGADGAGAGSGTPKPASEPATPKSERGQFRDDARKDSSDEDAPAADTSVLSPVGTAPDYNFAALASTHSEIKEEPSDTETIMNDEPVDMARARGLLRRKGLDSDRRAIKRALVYSSEDEDDEPLPKLTKSESTENESVNSEDKASSSRKSYKIKRDSTGRSQLQRACKKGDLDDVKRLLENGADPNESDFGGFTCLHEAALAGHTDIVKYLIQRGADVNKQALEAGDFETPLMDAAENKHHDTVQVLLQNGADPSICNTDGYSTITKLHHLSEEDDEYESIIQLLNSYASPQAAELSKVSQSRTVMQDPSEEYFLDLVKKKSNSLIYKYAAQGLKESVAEDFVTHAFTLKKMPDILNLAARNGHVELVDILLGLNPGSFDVNQKNKIGVTALLSSVGRGYYDVVKFLLSKGADPKITRDKDGLNALEVAKHAAQYDPREVLILEDALHGKLNLKQKKSDPEAVPTISKRSDPEAVPTISKKAEEKDVKPETRPETKPETEAKTGAASEAVSAGTKTDDTVQPVKKESPASKQEEISEKSKESAPAALGPALSVRLPRTPFEADDEKSDSRETQTPVTPREESKSPGPNGSPSAPLTKAQEEQRARALEQAKIWQEKVQAKKRARKEMFLLAEKEKERKRKEEEERRIEDLKRKELEKEEQLLKEAEAAKKLAAEAVRKKELMMAQFIREQYPVGLSEAIFDGNIAAEDRLKYAPLYVFDVAGSSHVLDMQIALLLAIPVARIHQEVKAGGAEVDAPTKEKLWTLFSSMLGVGRHNTVDKNGGRKFAGLQMRLVPLDAVAEYVKRAQAEAYRFVWEEKRVTKVDLESLEAGRVSVQGNGVGKPKETAECGFVPPKWRNRRDVLRTIHAANKPLW